MATDYYDDEYEEDLPDFSGQVISPSSPIDEILVTPPSERRDLLEHHVHFVAQDLGMGQVRSRGRSASTGCRFVQASRA